MHVVWWVIILWHACVSILFYVGEHDVVFDMDKHFETVRVLIWDARISYQDIGFALGLDPSTVDKIKRDHSDMGDGLNAVLQLAFQKGLTKNQLAAALDSGTVRMGQLARKVREANFKCKLCKFNQSS